MPDQKLEIHYDGDWAALYVDGHLDIVGDAYRTRERAFELAGVAEVEDNAFMRGQAQRDGVAQTTDEVAAYRTLRDVRATQAAELRERAKQLLAEADVLAGGTSA